MLETYEQEPTANMNIELRKKQFRSFPCCHGSVLFYSDLKLLTRHAIDPTVIEVASEVMRVNTENPAWFYMARA